MASSWVLKTRQMSEAGKEILLREALASHMRSTRDRQLFHELLTEIQPLRNVFSFFAAFYLHSYQGIRLLSPSEEPGAGSDMTDELDDEERRQLELEVRQLLGDKQREEIEVAKITSGLTIRLIDALAGSNPSASDTPEKALSLIKDGLGQISSEYNANHDIDLILEITGWAEEWRKDLYVKASGLKESALSLREELLRDHPAEVPETTVLRMGIEKIFGRVEYAKGRLLDAIVPVNWTSIVEDTVKRFSRRADDLRGLRGAHEIRIALLEDLESNYDTPTTLGEYENRLGGVVSGRIAEILETDSETVLESLANLLYVDSDEIRAQLRRRGISDPNVIGPGLKTLTAAPTADPSQPSVSKEEMETLERSLKTLEKMERLLDGPVKGFLKSKGYWSAELEKTTIDLLTKERDKLVGIEVEILKELKNKMRVPPPEEVVRLIGVREQVKSGALSGLGISSARDFTQQRTEEETVAALRLDIIWHFTIGLLTNLTRVVEAYIRSKQDLLRIKALLKSIYEDTESGLQNLREEILIDLQSMRIYEMKVNFPELDAQTICTWMHARLSNKDMMAAGKDLETSTSPVFEGIIDKPLDMSSLEFDNYAIAYDIMHRFLKQERLEKLAKEEFAFETKEKEKRRIEAKKEGIDVLMYLHNKALTVFRAISRVGTKGLEWSQNDTSKCANLLAYYIKNNRGRAICTACGTVLKGDSCSQHGNNFKKEATDIDNLSIFFMRSIYEIKEGLIGTGRGVEPMPWDKAKSTVDRELAALKRVGKLTSKTNLKELMPGDLNYVIGPALCAVVGKYFNESLVYAARRADIA
ncbi:MAG: hypothetical protein ACFFEW_16135 [Candidatus Thorarchaeota archaeon]